MGCYGYERDTTPQIDHLLAKRGVVFETAIAAHTNTAPSHASMFTGLYATGHGVLRNGMTMKPEVAYLPELLSERGYATGGFVSGWTLEGHTGLARGFDVYDDGTVGRDGTRRSAPQTLASALPWVRKQAAEDKPFFLFFHLFDPHFLYEPPQQDLEALLPKGKTKLESTLRGGLPRLKREAGFTRKEVWEHVLRYDAEIHAADRHIGALLEELERLGVADDTLVLFVADHGETLYERPWIFDHGGRAFDEQIRVPLVMRFPDDRHAGRRIEGQVSHVDLVRTVLDELGLDPPANVGGRSLLPLVKSESGHWDEPRPVFANARPEPARIPGVYRPLVREGLVATIRLPHLKLIEYPMTKDRWYRILFTLDSDPRERRNAKDERPRAARQLHERLEQWREETGGSKREAAPQLSQDAERRLRALGYVE